MGFCPSFFPVCFPPTRLARSEWKPFCDCILAWTFTDPQEVLRRSNLVALLLSRLTDQATEISALRQSMLTHLRELRRAGDASAKLLDGLEKLLSGWQG